jgi:hypothetical protein
VAIQCLHGAPMCCAESFIEFGPQNVEFRSELYGF